MTSAAADPVAEERLTIVATVGQLDALHAMLDRFRGTLERALVEAPEAAWWSELVTAVAEIASNIVRHAYPVAHEPGPIELCLRAYPGRVEAYFSDHGVAFTPPTAADAPDADLLALPESGWGLAIARAYLDELHYRRSPQGTNEWRLVKQFET